MQIFKARFLAHNQIGAGVWGLAAPTAPTKQYKIAMVSEKLMALSLMNIVADSTNSEGTLSGKHLTVAPSAQALTL